MTARPRLGEALRSEIAVLERRLVKSGPGYYAKARFDAIIFIAYTQVAHHPGEVSPADESWVRGKLGGLATAYPELDAVRFSRSRQETRRAEMLIDEVLASVGLRRQGPLDISIHVSRHVSQIAGKVADPANESSEDIVRLNLKRLQRS